MVKDTESDSDLVMGQLMETDEGKLGVFAAAFSQVPKSGAVPPPFPPPSSLYHALGPSVPSSVLRSFLPFLYLSLSFALSPRFPPLPPRVPPSLAPPPPLRPFCRSIIQSFSPPPLSLPTTLSLSLPPFHPPSPPPSRQVWCEGARMCLNPRSGLFDPARARRSLLLAIRFTPQYGAASPPRRAHTNRVHFEIDEER